MWNRLQLFNAPFLSFSLRHRFDDQVVGLCIWLHIRLAMAALVFYWSKSLKYDEISWNDGAEKMPSSHFVVLLQLTPSSSTFIFHLEVRQVPFPYDWRTSAQCPGLSCTRCPGQPETSKQRNYSSNKTLNRQLRQLWHGRYMVHFIEFPTDIESPWNLRKTPVKQIKNNRDAWSGQAC